MTNAYRRAVGSLVCVSFAVALVAGCEGRTLGVDNPEYECWDLWECNPDMECGPMVQCLDGRCRSDLGTVLVECPYGECLTDDDCVVAMPFDCCNGCPRVARRSDLAELPCFYELGTTPGDPPVDCLVDCMACPICFPQPLGVQCDYGLCLVEEEGCASELTTEAQLITTSALLTNPESYDGGTYRIQGTALPGLGGCDDDCPSPHCCEYGVLLDGRVLLQGNPCAMRLGFWGDGYCDGDLDTEGMLPGGEYEVSGVLRLNQSPEAPWTMDVTGVWVAEPRGIAGAFDVFVTAVIADADDPTCLPPTLEEGDWGKMYIAEDGGLLEIAAPVFGCWWEFLGTADPEGWFAAQAPITCDGICEYSLEGQVTGEMAFAAYTSLEDTCRYEYQFSGQRLPMEHTGPTF
ncbi:MAG: hypothetical protein ABI333_00765 [bacterium]